MIRCSDVIKLPSLKRLRLVAGEAGLDRVVGWVHVLDMPDVINWVRGGELLFMTGISLQSPLDLLGIVGDIAAKNLAGLVITPGKYIAAIPQEVLDLADSLNFPLFELPWEVKLVDVFQEVTSYINQRQSNQTSMQDILKNLVFGDIDNLDQLIRRAEYYGYDLTKPCQVMIVRINNIEGYVLRTKLNSGDGLKCETKLTMEGGPATETLETMIKDRFQQAVVDVVVRRYTKPIYLPWLDSLIVFLPVGQQAENLQHSIKIAEMIVHSLNRALPGLVVNIGLGNNCSGPQNIRKSLSQAEQALKFGIKTGQSSVHAYEQMGLHKLLFAGNEDVLHSFYKDYIADLETHDREHGTSLVRDLEVFLLYNGNFGDAARSLYLHRNTLIYRIRKVEELTGKSLDDFHNRICFYLGIMSGRHVLGNVTKN